MFYVFTKCPRDKMCQTKNLCHLIILKINKGSHDTESHCGYLISLVSAETPSVKTI